MCICSVCVCVYVLCVGVGGERGTPFSQGNNIFIFMFFSLDNKALPK